MRKVWGYINFSNLKLAIDCNPLVWSFRYMHMGPTEHDPYLHIWYFRILPLSVIFSLDNGEYIVYDKLDNLELKETDEKDSNQTLPDQL